MIMSSGRIQKLLYSEYSELEEIILVESPFAEITRDEKGLQQVYLGLTQHHLIIAADKIKPKEDTCMFCYEVDPYLCDFELISIYPLVLIHISVYCFRKKHVLKMHFCNNVVRYFELGGSENKKTHWKLWCDHIRFLCPYNPVSSQSETSAYSVSSSSSICLASTRIIHKPTGSVRLWQQFKMNGLGDSSQVHRKVNWPQKDQYFGIKHEKLPPQVGEIFCDSEMNLMFKNDHFREDSENDLNQCSSSESCVAKKQFIVNRFGSGIPENCTTALLMKPVKYLPTEPKYKCLAEKSGTETQRRVSALSSSVQADKSDASISNLEEASVQLWEHHHLLQRKKMRHPRRYGLEPLPFFLQGLGLSKIIPGDRYTAQMKRVPSAVSVCKSASFQHHLKSFSSCEELHKLLSFQPLLHLAPQYRVPVILFWTPDFSYKPALNTRCFRNFGGQMHLQQLACSSKGHTAHFQLDTGLKNALRTHLRLSSWEFDSETIAFQLTLIDRDLFLKLSVRELEIILQQRSSKNAFNFRAVVWFASRIASLVTSEILNEKSLKVRARLMCRFINAAHKCYTMNNFQSCRSIIAGLQCPPVYRLRQSWAVIRRHYVSRYRLFEEMCRHYSSPHSHMCSEEFEVIRCDVPFLPYLGCLLSCLLTDTALAWKHVPVFSSFQQVTSTDACYFFEPVLTEVEMNVARLREVSELLITSQKAASHFNLPVNKVAQSFLLKTQYNGDVDNFFRSGVEDCRLIPKKCFREQLSCI